ncbi:MAG: putative lipid II flippase FtsW [Gammaproteobacteria bacterium]
MVASASIVISENQYGYPFHYLFRQLFYFGIGMAATIVVLKIRMETWLKLSVPLLLLCIILLILVLIPGIGRAVNGSARWLGVGPLRLQVSEIVKLGFIIYLAGYIVRHPEELQYQLSGFIKPLIILGVIGVLLLLEPDFGAAVVLMLTAMAILFLGGARLKQFVVMAAIGVCLIGILAISSPYRLQRLTSFLNPWANAFSGGYQLTQALIAFGRGGWIGVGLGESIQKLFYLPEAHTDFIYAVLVEELGLLGGLIVIALYTLLVIRGLVIARRSHKVGHLFQAHVAYGITFWLGLQAMISIGVNCGVLPTKGLTLPLMSYGGSSMLVNCIAIALLLRIDYETRRVRFGLN